MDRLANANPYVRLVGDFVDMHTPITLRCNQCSNEWRTSPYKPLNGHRCRICALKERDHSHCGIRKTQKEFEEELFDISPSIRVISAYVNSTTNVACECDVCTYKWSAKPYNLLTGYGCPQCAKERTVKRQHVPHEELAERLSKVNPTVEFVERCNGANNSVLCKCKLCGGMWRATPTNLTKSGRNRTGCPHCRRSHGEDAVKRWLDANGVQYLQQAKFDDLRGLGGGMLSYDFFLPQKRVLIEYQGEYHDHTARLQREEDYTVQREHDMRKLIYAESKGYRLVYVWYYDQIEDKLQELLCDIVNPVTTTAS